jgi:hypothetical protein
MHFVLFDVVACADLTTHVRIPLFDIPLEADRRDSRGSPDWKKACILCEEFACLQSPNHVAIASQDPGETDFREQPQP